MGSMAATAATPLFHDDPNAAEVVDSGERALQIAFAL